MGKSLHAFAIAATATLALLLPAPARATGVYSASQQACSAAIEAETAKLVQTVHDQIRASIAENMKASTLPCSGPLVCSGGPKSGTPCSANSTCSAGGFTFECQPQTSAGIAGVLNQAKANLRNNIAAACSLADLSSTVGSSRCDQGASTPDELADCIMRATVGEPGQHDLVGTVGEIMAYGAPRSAVDDPVPLGICAVPLGRRVDTGTYGNEQITAFGNVERLVADGCTAGNPICNTKGVQIVGNMIQPPLQTYAGIIAICLVSTSVDAGNGTPESGTINMATGQQSSTSGIQTTVLIGTTCPVCDVATKICGPVGGGGPNLGMVCTRPGETDIACPPTVIGTPPVFVTPLDATTEFSALAVPPNNPAAGVTNPAGVFCGSCDIDSSIGCSRDQDCNDVGVCGVGTGHGCCQFGANVGAFGDALRTTIVVGGTRGAFIAQLAGLNCLGQSGDALVDNTVGLPGPARRLEVRLNVFDYTGAFGTPVPITPPPTKTPTTIAPPGTSTPTPTKTRTFTRTATRTVTKTRTRLPTRTPTKTHIAGKVPCGDFDDCIKHCSDDKLCNCLCRNRLCAECRIGCPMRVCPFP